MATHFSILQLVKKAYVSVNSEVSCNFLIAFGITTKMVQLIKISFSETHVTDRIGKSLVRFVVRMTRDALSPLFFKLVLEYAARKVQVNHQGLKFSDTYQFLGDAKDVNLLGEKTYCVDTHESFISRYLKEVSLE
jgi:hypothetical protein